MQSVGECIAQHREDILKRWAAEAQSAAAARGMSGPELRELVPFLLSALSDAERPESELRRTVESQLTPRIRRAFDLSEIVEEFVLLEGCLASLWASLPLDQRPHERDRLKVAGLMHRILVRLTEILHEQLELDEQWERRCLQLLQAIADQSLWAPDAPLQLRLRELLELVLEAMTADTAALVLYEPQTDRLITAAAAGDGEQELERFARSLRPPTCRADINIDLETTGCPVDEPLRGHGIQHLLQIRLPARHSLSGVLYLGLREQRVLNARESRRLETFGNDLMLHLDSAKVCAELSQHVEELGRERDLRERFVSILAHDLRGPLCTARLSSQLLVHRPGRPGELRKIALRIGRNLDRIERMICDLLDVSRVRAGQRLPLELAPSDLGLIAREVVEELNASQHSRFELSAEDGVVGIWSEQELRRALWNLGTNAAKYGVLGRPVTIRVERTTGEARVSVHNFGRPIAPEHRAGLFELYSRASERGSGWGVGLALVRACADAHGGRVSVESSSEAGTTFTLELPIDSRPFQQSAPARQEASEICPAAPG
jgi:signal transduction histidine kinase